MPLVHIWECPRTGKLFKEKKKYQEHLKLLARDCFENRSLERHKASYQKHIEDTLLRVTSFQEIENWFLDQSNARKIAMHVNRVKPNSFRSLIDVENFRIISMKFSGMSWHECCPNSHHAPRGEKPNWNRNKELPMGFPGWGGNIEWKVPRNMYVWWNEIFDSIPIHVGSGGSGDQQNFRHNVILFGTDWASMAVMRKLTG